MFSKISIRNFKSIRGLEFAPKRVNVLIGDPNSGKSNLLEALAVFSESDAPFHERLRFKSVGDLFYDRNLTEDAGVKADGWEWWLHFDISNYAGTCIGPESAGQCNFALDQDGTCTGSQPVRLPARYYSFKQLPAFKQAAPGYLIPPYGSNLVTVLSGNKPLKALVAELFREKGYRLSIDIERNELLLTKDVNEQVYQFSYATVSETLRRVVFYLAALESNKDAVLLLDQPEGNLPPFFTSYLAEHIATKDANQVFLATHNPHLVGSLIAKTPRKELAVFVTQMVNHKTELKPVTSTGLTRILEAEGGPETFQNLNRLTEK